MDKPRVSREEFEVKKVNSIAVMSDNGTYTKECNIVSWNDGTPKLDIRGWRGEKPLKGITLDDDESKALYEGLKAYYEGK